MKASRARHRPWPLLIFLNSSEHFAASNSNFRFSRFLHFSGGGDSCASAPAASVSLGKTAAATTMTERRSTRFRPKMKHTNAKRRWSEIRRNRKTQLLGAVKKRAALTQRFIYLSSTRFPMTTTTVKVPESDPASATHQASIDSIRNTRQSHFPVTKGNHSPEISQSWKHSTFAFRLI